MQEIIDSVDVILKNIKDLEEKEQIETINKLSVLLNSYTRFKTEPVNCIQWVPFDSVRANDYNPNSVAPPEMELLKVSISEDGYTQPVPKKVLVYGQQALGMFLVGTDSLQKGHYASEHDKKIANKLGYVMAGGDLSEPTYVSEQYLLDIEREAFMSLMTERKTLERIEHMLKTGKPLRN